MMTTDSTRYDEVHERIEAEGIAACDREQMEFDLARIDHALQELKSFGTRTKPENRCAPQALQSLARVKRRFGELGELPAD